ncbi:hypothetical protein [Azospirillum brasilense]|uniref:hypothetical protein n=1 Tax=Azospirillum brasilense TaxID=192 RepID=UPI0011C3DA89|nr:hypothetical protein [Azospirillum brasilense]NUB25098.1 hypothetical protein [Azospirillum brasilense]NUB30578.1 hypothetical protein [Azospirillum brasilense]
MNQKALLSTLFALVALSGCANNIKSSDPARYFLAIDRLRIASTGLGYDEQCLGTANVARDTYEYLYRSTKDARDMKISEAEIAQVVASGKSRGQKLVCGDASMKLISSEMKSVDNRVNSMVQIDSQRFAAQSRYDRDYAECQYQSDLAIASVRGFVNRVTEGASLIQQCMALRGYR